MVSRTEHSHWARCCSTDVVRALHERLESLPAFCCRYICHPTPPCLCHFSAPKMSGPGENRYVPEERLRRIRGTITDTRHSWRRQGQANRNSGASTPTKDSGRQQAMPAPTGNVWGAKQAKASGPAPAAAAQAQPEHHVPVKDFNANEVKEFLKKSMYPRRHWNSIGSGVLINWANNGVEYLESTASTSHLVVAHE